MQADAGNMLLLTNEQVLTLGQVFLVQRDQLLAVHLQRCNVCQYAHGDVAMLVAVSRHFVDGRCDLVRTGWTIVCRK